MSQQISVQINHKPVYQIEWLSVLLHTWMNKVLTNSPWTWERRVRVSLCKRDTPQDHVSQKMFKTFVLFHSWDFLISHLPHLGLSSHKGFHQLIPFGRLCDVLCLRMTYIRTRSRLLAASCGQQTTAFHRKNIWGITSGDCRQDHIGWGCCRLTHNTPDWFDCCDPLPLFQTTPGIPSWLLIAALVLSRGLLPQPKLKWSLLPPTFRVMITDWIGHFAATSSGMCKAAEGKKDKRVHFCCNFVSMEAPQPLFHCDWNIAQAVLAFLSPDRNKHKKSNWDLCTDTCGFVPNNFPWQTRCLLIVDRKSAAWSPKRYKESLW